MGAGFVAEEDLEHEDECAGGGEEEEEDGEAGVAEDAEGGVDAHEECGADDEGGEDESEGDAVGDFLEAGHEVGFVDGVDVDGELIVGDGVHDAVDAVGESLSEFFHFQARAKMLPGERDLSMRCCMRWDALRRTAAEGSNEGASASPI